MACQRHCRDVDVPHKAVVNCDALCSTFSDALRFVHLRATISEALGLNGDPEEVDMLERKVEALNNKMLALVNESVSSGDGIEAHESEFMTLSQETELLKQRIAAIQESTAKDNGEQSRLEQIQAIISERESKCMEYDDSIVRQMVECIKVYPGGKLEIIFGGGYLVEESV